jgi:hypothetical protein
LFVKPKSLFLTWNTILAYNFDNLVFGHTMKVASCHPDRRGNHRAVDQYGDATTCRDTGSAGFTHMERHEDHAVGLLLFWTTGGKQLFWVAVNAACPASGPLTLVRLGSLLERCEQPVAE